MQIAIEPCLPPGGTPTFALRSFNGRSRRKSERCARATGLCGAARLPRSESGHLAFCAPALCFPHPDGPHRDHQSLWRTVSSIQARTSQTAMRLSPICWTSSISKTLLGLRRPFLPPLSLPRARARRQICDHGCAVVSRGAEVNARGVLTHSAFKF